MKTTNLIALSFLVIGLGGCDLLKDNSLDSELKETYCNVENESEQSKKEQLLYHDSSLNKINTSNYQTIYDKGSIKCLSKNENTVVIHNTNNNEFVMGVFFAVKNTNSIKNTISELNIILSKTKLKITELDLKNLFKEKQLKKNNNFMLYLDDYNDGYIITINEV